MSRHTANRNEINLGQEDKIKQRRKNGIWITIRNSVLHFLKLDRSGKITVHSEEQKSPESHSKGSVAANILKGAAAAGLAVGGTAITQGMDVQAAETATEMTVDTQATIATAEEAVIETGEATAEKTPAETTQADEAMYQDTPTEVSSSEAVQASDMEQKSAAPQESETPQGSETLQESETPSSQETAENTASESVSETIPEGDAQESIFSESQGSEAASSEAGLEQQQESTESNSSSSSAASSEQGLTSETGSESAENVSESVSAGSDSVSSQDHSVSQEESAVTASEAALSSDTNLTSESLSENTPIASETPSEEEEVSNSMASESAPIRRHAPQRNAAIQSVSSLDNTDSSAIADSASEAAASASRSEAAAASLSASSSQSLSVSASESDSTAVLTSESMSAEAVAADNTDPLEDIKRTVNSYSIYADTVNINGHMQSDLAANHLNMGNKAEIGSDNIYDKTNQKTFIGDMSKQSYTENIMPGDATNEILLSNKVYTITRSDGTTYQQPKFVYQNADGSYITSYFDSNNVEQKAPSGYIYVYQYDETGNYTIFTMQTNACKDHNNSQDMSIRKVDYTVDIDGVLKDSNQISTKAKNHNENRSVVSMHNSGDIYTGIDATKSSNSIVYTNLDLTNKMHPWGTTDSVVSANGESQDKFSESRGVRVNVKTDASGKASQTVVINVNYIGAVEVDYNNNETPITESDPSITIREIYINGKNQGAGTDSAWAKNYRDAVILNFGSFSGRFCTEGG